LLFEPYRFDNLETDESIFVDGWSYFWAAIGGPIYLLAKGYLRQAALMAVLSAMLALGVATALILIAGLFGDIVIPVVSAIALPLMALAAQSVIAVQLQRAALISRGWREGY